jgi:ribosomal protein S20
MPIIKSAKKRVKVARKATIRNSKTKRSLKASFKAFGAAVAGKDKKAGEALSKVQSEIDKAAKKGVMHKNKAARKQSQAARAAKAAGVKPATKAKAAKPAAAPKKAAPAKKPAAKKPATAAKPIAKKAPAKKPAAKKK